jgi:hypothetical protein
MAKAQAQPAQRGKTAAQVGRPTKFDAKLLRQARELALLGLTDVEMAKVFDVAKSTFNLWKQVHPEFAAALNSGKTIADAQVAASLHHRAIGYSHPETVITAWQGTILKSRVVRHYPPDTQAALKWLHNRRPTLWRAQPEPTDSPDVPAPVKVVVQVQTARVRADDADPE